MAKNIYSKLHGNISPHYGFVVPTNYGKKVTVSFHAIPGSTLNVYLDNVNVSDIPAQYKYSSGKYVFDVDLAVEHPKDGFILDGGLTHLSDNGTPGSFDGYRENYLLFIDKDDEYIKGSKFIEIEGKDFMALRIKLSQLVFELMTIYPGRELNISVFSCLSFDTQFECEGIRDMFNIVECESHVVNQVSGTNNILKVVRAFLGDKIIDTSNVGRQDKISVILDKTVNKLTNSMYVRKSNAPGLFDFLIKKKITSTANVIPVIIYVDKENNEWSSPMISTNLMESQRKFYDLLLGIYYALYSKEPVRKAHDTLENIDYIGIGGINVEDGKRVTVNVQFDTSITNIVRGKSDRDLLSKTKSYMDDHLVRDETIVDRLKYINSLYIEHRLPSINTDELNELIRVLSDEKCLQVIVIPYYLICRLFYPEQPTKNLLYPQTEDDINFSTPAIRINNISMVISYILKSLEN
jgi:hypothetical protein